MQPGMASGNYREISLVALVSRVNVVIVFAHYTRCMAKAKEQRQHLEPKQCVWDLFSLCAFFSIVCSFIMREKLVCFWMKQSDLTQSNGEHRLHKCSSSPILCDPPRRIQAHLVSHPTTEKCKQTLTGRANKC